MTGLDSNHPNVFVIFGGTGDLTYRKLLPAFYDLVLQGVFDANNLKIVIIGRRDYNSQTFLERALTGIEANARFKKEDLEAKQKLSQMVSYYKMDYHDLASYAGLREYLSSLFETAVRYQFYLAVAPSSFSIITEKLRLSHILEDVSAKQLLIEKPFGNDLQSAIDINAMILKSFKEDEIYRIDHYLAKEMIINIMTIRFGNQVFESLWKYGEIDNIQITATETIGVEDRGSYYDHSGALEDMVQSHLLQVLTLLMMKEPTDDSPEAIHTAQTEVLKNLELFDTIENSYIRGQYVSDGKVNSYRDEERVDPQSSTETYAAVEFRYNKEPFKDVPIYVRTGKRMDKAGTYVAVQFKPSKMYDGRELDPNVLIIRIGPDEGIYLRVNIKKPGITSEVQPIKMDFCQSCILENRYNTPQAYERLLRMALEQDHTLFASWDFANISWEIIDAIQKRAVNNPLYEYEVFSSGPDAADEMLERNGHYWINDTVYGETFKF